MHALTALVLFLTPLRPADIPANQIYLGEHIEPITAIKVRQGWVAPGLSMVLTPFEFTELKSAIENSPDLCTHAIGMAVKQCQSGLKREQQIFLDREANDAQLITSYENRLKMIETELQTSYKQNKMLMYLAAGLSAIAGSATIYAIMK